MKRVDIDAKGLACPQPVIMTKKALEENESGEIVISVDNEPAKENISRMAQTKGYPVTVKGNDNGFFEITIRKARGSAESLPAVKSGPEDAGGKLVYVFDADFIGTNRDLGKVLTNGFLNAALSLDNKNASVILISNGVKLAVKKSYALDVLTRISDAGIPILVCGTCLDFFKVRNKLQVGTVSNALEIMECMTGAAKVIKF